MDGTCDTAAIAGVARALDAGRSGQVAQQLQVARSFTCARRYSNRKRCVCALLSRRFRCDSSMQTAFCATRRNQEERLPVVCQLGQSLRQSSDDLWATLHVNGMVMALRSSPGRFDLRPRSLRHTHRLRRRPFGGSSSSTALQRRSVGEDIQQRSRLGRGIGSSQKRDAAAATQQPLSSGVYHAKNRQLLSRK
jgi:hypothetical protein